MRHVTCNLLFLGLSSHSETKETETERHCGRVIVSVVSKIYTYLR